MKCKCGASNIECKIKNIIWYTCFNSSGTWICITGKASTQLSDLVADAFSRPSQNEIQAQCWVQSFWGPWPKRRWSDLWGHLVLEKKDKMVPVLPTALQVHHVRGAPRWLGTTTWVLYPSLGTMIISFVKGWGLVSIFWSGWTMSSNPKMAMLNPPVTMWSSMKLCYFRFVSLWRRMIWSHLRLIGSSNNWICSMSPQSFGEGMRATTNNLGRFDACLGSSRPTLTGSSHLRRGFPYHQTLLGLKPLYHHKPQAVPQSKLIC